MADNTLAHARTDLASVRRHNSLSHALTGLAVATLCHSLSHGTTCSPAAQSLRDGPAAGAAVRLWRSRQDRKARHPSEGCLTTRCSGGHAAQFLTFLSTPFVAPLNVSVRCPKKSAYMKKRNNDFLNPAVTPFANCHTCRELVRLGTERCPHCGIKLDQEEIFPSAAINFLISQAYSSANNIRTFDPAVVIFLALLLMRYLSDYPLWFNLVTSVVWLGPVVIIIRWFRKHGRWNISDSEYEYAKKEMRAGLRLWIAAHLFNAIVILILWMKAHAKAT